MNSPLTSSEVQAYYRARVPDLNQRGHEWRGPCPIHRGKNPSFAVQAETGTWFCHSKCQQGGSAIDLEMALAGTDFFAQASILSLYDPDRAQRFTKGGNEVSRDFLG